jgi:hypothetical protein
VFVSHSSRDAAVAMQIVRALERDGVRCWIAPRDIPAGADYSAAIMDGISKCRALLLVYTQHASDSDPVLSEVERARSRKAPLIPVRLEDVKPSPSLEFMISRFHWIDAFPPPLDDHLDELVRSVHHALGQVSSSEKSSQAIPWTTRMARSWRRRKAFVGGVIVGLLLASLVAPVAYRRIVSSAAETESASMRAALAAGHSEVYDSAIVHVQVEREVRDGQALRVVKYRQYFVVRGLNESAGQRTLRREEWNTTWGTGVSEMTGTEKEVPEDSGSPNRAVYFVEAEIPPFEPYSFVTGGQEQFPLEKQPRSIVGGKMQTGSNEGNFSFDAAGRHYGEVLAFVESETLDLSPGKDGAYRILPDNTIVERSTVEDLTNSQFAYSKPRRILFARWHDVKPNEAVGLIYAWHVRENETAR